MSFAIRVENLGKRYELGATHVGSVRELVNRAWNRAFGRSDRVAPQRAPVPVAANRVEGNSFWAIRDVSFEVKRGEVVGIIGRNGSGKSTLLKILSQITAPTTGRVELHGRVASLLEVGTGFHPELSGRENIFLNGAILGMTKSEIRRKFDEIVAFAEIEKFIDTPVKRYSSGMYVRLAFAVAAHLEPEILIVDEVLAVGDAEFQKKCLGKIGDVARGGRTVLFVSHNMAVVSSMCDRCVLLKSGAIDADGSARNVSNYYQQSAIRESNSGSRDLTGAPRGALDQKIRFTRITTTNLSGQVTSRFAIGDPIRFSIQMKSEIDSAHMEVGLTIKTLADVALFTTSSTDEAKPYRIQRGVHTFEVTLEPNYLRPGVYTVQIGTTCGMLRDFLPDALQITVDDSEHYCKNFLYNLPGHLYFPLKWLANSSSNLPTFDETTMRTGA